MYQKMEEFKSKMISEIIYQRTISKMISPAVQESDLPSVEIGGRFKNIFGFSGHYLITDDKQKILTTLNDKPSYLPVHVNVGTDRIKFTDTHTNSWKWELDYTSIRDLQFSTRKKNGLMFPLENNNKMLSIFFNGDQRFVEFVNLILERYSVTNRRRAAACFAMTHLEGCQYVFYNIVNGKRRRHSINCGFFITKLSDGTISLYVIGSHLPSRGRTNRVVLFPELNSKIIFMKNNLTGDHVVTDTGFGFIKKTTILRKPMDEEEKKRKRIGALILAYFTVDERKIAMDKKKKEITKRVQRTNGFRINKDPMVFVCSKQLVTRIKKLLN